MGSGSPHTPRDMVREAVEVFTELCRETGGRSSVVETGVSLRARCVYPRRTSVHIAAGRRSGLVIDVERLEGGKPTSRLVQLVIAPTDLPPTVELTAIAGSRGRVSTAHVATGHRDDENPNEPRGGFITGSFSEIRFVVMRDYSSIHIWLGEEP